MKNRQIAALFLCGIMSLSLLAGCASNTADADNSQNDNAQTTEDGMKALYLSEQGIFSAGGITVTSDGTFDPENQWEETEPVRPPMWITPMCSIRSPQRKPDFPWYSCTAMASPAWAG